MMPFEEVFITSTSNKITVYPCSRGTDAPVGWHDFAFSNGVVVCRWCGKLASK